MQVPGTHGQSFNPEWFKQREWSISASEVDKVWKLFKPFHIEDLLNVNNQDEKMKCMQKLASILHLIRDNGSGSFCEAVSWALLKNTWPSHAMGKCEKGGLGVSQTG